MPYTNTRRLYHMIGRKVSKYVMYRKAKRLYSEINRDMHNFESKFIRSRHLAAY